MEQRISLVTLGVDDLPRARDFYERGLGWVPTGNYQGVSFYQLPGIAFALFGRDELAADSRRPVDGRSNGVATQAISQIRTGMCGRSPSIRRGPSTTTAR